MRERIRINGQISVARGDSEKKPSKLAAKVQAGHHDFIAIEILLITILMDGMPVSSLG